MMNGIIVVLKENQLLKIPWVDIQKKKFADLIHTWLAYLMQKKQEKKTDSNSDFLE